MKIIYPNKIAQMENNGTRTEGHKDEMRILLEQAVTGTRISLLLGIQ
jgi:hypothetical protein